MKQRGIVIAALGLGLSLVLVLGWLARSGARAAAQDTGPGSGRELTPQYAPESGFQDGEALGTAFTYQGYLDDADAPADGSYDLQFALFDAVSGGSQIGSTNSHNDVTIINGQFGVKLDFGGDALTGEARFLEIAVRLGSSSGAFTTLHPRQELTPAPYALYAIQVSSHSHLGETWTGTDNSLKLIGSFGLPDRAPLVLSNSAAEGNGLQVVSAANDGVHIDSAGEDGVYVGSAVDDGIHIQGAGSDGVWVNSTADDGVHVQSADSDGVYVEAAGEDGVQVVSAAEDGGWFATARGDNNYGVYTPDNLYSLNYHTTGATMHIVQNGGDEALEMGDVVVFSGLAPSFKSDGPPIIQVSKAAAANSSAIAGVVASRFNIQAVTEEPQPDSQEARTSQVITPEGAVAPGEYLLLVVQGLAQVKASAMTSRIQPGDLLSSATEDGHASRCAEVAVEGITSPVPGTVLGKALEPLDDGEGFVYVFVTLQ